MIHPFRFLFGYTRLCIPASEAGDFLNLCRERGFVYREFTFAGEEAYFESPFFGTGRLLRACSARGLTITAVRAHGLPALVKRYRHRYGVLVGLLLFAAILFASEQVIWDVRVEGNERVREREVEEALASCGLSVGTPRRALNIDFIENRFLIDSETISWISVNVVGTVANVQVREVEPIPERSPDYAAADLVAARGGTVEWFEDVRGNVAVSIGDDVAEGDLLVGGLYGGEGIPARYTCARGRVMARTEHLFSAEIPLAYEKKTYTGRVFEEKYLIFFKKEVKFFGNTGNSPPTCDTIETVSYFLTGDGQELPVGIRTVRYYEYETEQAHHTEERAKELAAYALRIRMEEELAEAELLSKRMHAEVREGVYVMTCRVECVENIAKTVEIPLRGLP